jgi:hypothetical protein
MQPNSHAYNEMQLPPLEQTVVTDRDERSILIENSDKDTDHSRRLVVTNT